MGNSSGGVGSRLPGEYVRNQFYTVLEVATMLGVSRSTIDRMAKRDELPGRRMIGGQVRYFKPEIDRFIRGEAG